MIIFDGHKTAAQHETQLLPRVQALKAQGKQPQIAAILFTEDAGSNLYTRLKKEAAERLGMKYEVFSFSLGDEVKVISQKLTDLNADDAFTGIIIQKPGKPTWLKTQPAFENNETANAAFSKWWQALVSQIALPKDVDGLHPQTLAAIQAGNWQEQGRVMPATAKAVMEILKVAAAGESDEGFFKGKRIVILGKSDIVGKPLYYELLNKKCEVEMIGSKELNEKIAQKKYLFEFDIVISSTGRAGLITAELLKQGAIVIDVGEPKADVNPDGIETKASFLTPVPGGVGPMTVMCLLENAVELCQ